MTRKLLIIDDDRAIAHLTALRMRAAGYAVDVAFDGESGLTKAKSDPPDAILLDIRMPNIDGFEVHKRLQADAALAQTPVIFLSANAAEIARQRAGPAAAWGATEFIAKPYDVAHLIAAVERRLGPDSQNLTNADPFAPAYGTPS